MRKQRIFLVILLVAALLCTFTGCPVSPGQTQTAAGQPTTQQTTPSTSETVMRTPHKLTVMIREVDFDGYVCWDGRESLNVWQDIQRMLAERGLEIEWIVVEPDVYEETLKNMLAGDVSDMPDLVWLGELDDAAKRSAVDADKLLALEEVLRYSDGTAAAWLEAHPLYRAKLQYNGKLWWFGSYREVVPADAGAGAPSALVIREDFAWRMGMERIPDTVEELETYLQNCRDSDMSENGKQDEGMVLCLDRISRGGLGTFYGVPAGEFVPNLETGRIDVPWESSGVRDMLKTYLDWLGKGYLSTEMIGAESDAAWLNYDQPAACYADFYDNWASRFRGEVPLGAGEPLLAGIIPDKAQYPNAYIPRDAFYSIGDQSLAVTANCDDLPGAAAILDLITSEEYGIMLEWGTAGLNYDIDENGEFLPMCGISATPPIPGDIFFSDDIFPDVFSDYDLEEPPLQGSEWIMEQIESALSWEIVYPSNPNDFYAAPTGEELALLEQLEQSYNQLSAEIFQKILRGQIDIDTQWETEVIGPLNQAGMQELKAVYQACFDRFLQAAEEQAAQQLPLPEK